MCRNTLIKAPYPQNFWEQVVVGLRQAPWIGPSISMVLVSVICCTQGSSAEPDGEKFSLLDSTIIALSRDINLVKHEGAFGDIKYWEPNHSRDAPPLVVTGKIVGVQNDKSGSHVLLQVRSFYGQNDVVACFRQGGGHILWEHWEIKADEKAPSGKLVLWSDSKAVAEVWKRTGQACFMVLRPIANRWRSQVESLLNDEDFTEKERLEMIDRSCKGRFSAASSFDSRIPWAQPISTELLGRGGLEHYSKAVRREIDLQGLDAEEAKRCLEKISALKGGKEDIALVRDMLEWAPWQAALVGSMKLCEWGEKTGLANLVDMIEFEAEHINAWNRAKKEAPDLGAERHATGSGLVLLIHALEQFTAQSFDNVLAYRDWFKKHEKALTWDEKLKKFLVP